MRDHRIFGEAVQNYYQTIFEENLRKYERQINRAKTREDALKIVAAARARVKKAWNFPEKKCPLEAEVLKRKNYGDIVVENIIFKSRPDFTVTANFYLPAKIKGKIPAILFVQGHSNIGKHSGAYVIACENLARRGIAVLSVDPIQQGERDQFNKSLKGSCTLGHNRLNRQLMALGETMSDWRTYDGIRSVDYLLTRPEVDPARIGINGNSGGGTMTAMIFANDTRIMAAAPSCYITTFCHNVQNELADTILSYSAIKTATQKLKDENIRLDRKNAVLGSVKVNLQRSHEENRQLRDEVTKLTEEKQHYISANSQLKATNKKLSADNLIYKQRIGATANDIRDKESIISDLRSELSETVNAATELESQTSNRDATIQKLRQEVKAATALVQEYQDAYANMYASAVGVNLEGVSVTASTTVKELQSMITGSINHPQMAVTATEQLDVVDDIDSDGIITV